MKRLFDPKHEIGESLTGLRPVLNQVAAYSLILNLLYLLPSIYMLQIYDRVLSSRNVTTLVMLTLIVLVLYALFGTLEWVRSQLLIRVGVQMDRDLGERVFSAASTRYLDRSGGNPAQAMQDLNAVRQFVAGAGAMAFLDAPWAPIYLIVITLVHPYLGLFSLVAMIILVGLTWLNELLTHKPLSEANQAAMQAQVYANNNLRNAEAVVALGMLPALRKRWLEKHEKVLALQVLASDRGGSISALSKTLRIVFQSLILGLGAWLVLEDAVTGGTMIAASILMGRALAPVEQLIVAWKQWVSASSAFERMQELLQRYPAPAPALTLPAPKGEVTCEAVSTVPPGGKLPVLRNLSFRIQPGDVVGVLGPSGAGKSTLMRLMVGIWPAKVGTMRLDGADVFAWPKDKLGPYVGYLPQDIGLVEGSVAENICRFGELDSEKIVLAARMAGVHDLILQLPQGYETPVGVDGGMLSGGQRQRIALARALYGNPRLLVLDEPNSNLDELGETALLSAVAQASAAGATVVYVSHSPRFVAAASKLLILRDGQLFAYGPRDQVVEFMKNGGKPAVQNQGQGDGNR